VARAVVPRRLQIELHTAVVPQSQTLLRQRRAEHVPAQTFQSCAVPGGHPHIRVQIEAVQMGMTWAARTHRRGVGLLAEAAHPGPAARAQRDAPLH